METNRDTEIATANLKAFVPLHLDLDSLITFLESSGRVFVLSRENGRVKIAYLACLNWKMQLVCHRHYHRVLAMVLEGVCPARWGWGCNPGS